MNSQVQNNVLLSRIQRIFDAYSKDKYSVCSVVMHVLGVMEIAITCNTSLERSLRKHQLGECLSNLKTKTNVVVAFSGGKTEKTRYLSKSERHIFRIFSQAEASLENVNQREKWNGTYFLRLFQVYSRLPPPHKSNFYGIDSADGLDHCEQSALPAVGESLPSICCQHEQQG